jgi:general secretion pathway protein K
LIITLLIISVLVVTVTETMRRMQVEQASAAIYVSTARGRAVNRSAQALVAYLLAQDRKDPEDTGKGTADHYGEPWALFPDQDQVDLPPLPDGALNATVVDEQGKFPINSLVTEDGAWSEPHRQTLVNLLGSPPFSLPREKLEMIMPRIKDWLDTDSNPSGVHGAEADTYALEEGRISCRNGPLLFAGELAFIQDMPGKIFKQTDDRPGLLDLISVHTRGAININTARPEILAAMVNPDIPRETAREFASTMAAYRRDPMHYDFLSEPDWYRNRMAGYNDVQLPAELVAVSSDIYALMLRADIGGIQTSRYIVLRRKISKGTITFDPVHKETE